ncbi:MAG: hypothetical protein D3924_03325 [Candidatus Electrothrix sp. AR4]|nr:hypothetical protein [Candidatus Electrothrix sp. AR4]
MQGGVNRSENRDEEEASRLQGLVENGAIIQEEYDPADASRNDVETGKNVACILRAWGFWVSVADLFCTRRNGKYPDNRRATTSGFFFSFLPPISLLDLGRNGRGDWRSPE